MTRVFTIGLDRRFADVLARGILAAYGEEPLALADALILLPTRRSVRALREAFLRASEGRPLLLAYIASPENLQRLEAIRQNNLLLAGGKGTGTADENAPVIVWLSYNVHGNEPASSEAAMKTLYELVDPGNEKARGWLKNTVVIIDPCINPDGRDRYHAANRRDG